MNIGIADTPTFSSIAAQTFEMMRETSFISSSEISSPEYNCIRRLTRDLRTAIQDDLQDISDQLLSYDMITRESYQDFTNWSKPAYARAASLVQTILNRVELDSNYYYDFIQVLEKNKQYYNPVLQNMYLYSHDVSLQRRPLSSGSQHHSDEESQSDCESSALIRVPYVQYEDGASSECRQVKLRPCFPSVKVGGSFWLISLSCCCLAILEIMMVGPMFLFCYALYHNVISVFVLLVTSIIACQLFIVVSVIIVLCINTDRICLITFINSCITCITVIALLYKFQ